jgi:hypothetical protein
VLWTNLTFERERRPVCYVEVSDPNCIKGQLKVLSRYCVAPVCYVHAGTPRSGNLPTEGWDKARLTRVPGGNKPIHKQYRIPGRGNNCVDYYKRSVSAPLLFSDVVTVHKRMRLIAVMVRSMESDVHFRLTGRVTTSRAARSAFGQDPAR